MMLQRKLKQVSYHTVNHEKEALHRVTPQRPQDLFQLLQQFHLLH